MEAYNPPLEGRRGRIRLDFNENTAGFPWAFPEAECEFIGAYPEYADFLEKISGHFRVPAERLMLTNGTGEALFLIAFTFIEPGKDAALTSYPTFALIPHNLRLAGANLTEVPATPDWEFDIEKIEAGLESGIKLAIFASPDNPTGATISPETVERWCAEYPETLFVIDEAYAEYCETTALPLTDEFTNLLVTRTFSKAWAMPGLRLGVIFGNPELLGYMLRVRAPYSVNSASLLGAAKLIERSDEVTGRASALIDRKKPLLDAVSAKGFRTHAGQGNFFLLPAGIDARLLCEFCRDRGLLLRDRSSYAGMEGIVRITVGTEEENSELLKCLDEFRESRALIFDLDDTLVDTSRSFDVTVMKLVEQYSGKSLAREELLKLRNEGGFNDDWDATVELLRRRGIETSRNEIAPRGIKLYLSLARENEEMLVDLEMLKELGKRYRLFMATGRIREEYAVWADTLDPFFEAVYCRDDLSEFPPKPAPDTLKAIMERHNLTGGIYIGNSVDDMKSAAGAGLTAVGVETNTAGKLLLEAGASGVIESTSDIGKVFRL
jgi:histidinol-phosphate aminotransferase